MKNIINNIKSKINTIRNGKTSEVGFIINTIKILYNFYENIKVYIRGEYISPPY